MPKGRKPIYGKFRIETLETQIAVATTCKQYDAIDALRNFARITGVSLDEYAIAEKVEMFLKELNRRSTQE